MCSEGNSAVAHVSNHGDIADLHHHKAIPGLGLEIPYRGVYGSTNPGVDLMSTSSLNKEQKKRERGEKRACMYKICIYT